MLKEILKSRSFFQGKRCGETLVEVIIAIFVVALGSTVATSLIVTALQSNSFSRDNLIALNLAEEGIEAVRSVRDTNWLKYAFDKENCWNILPAKKECIPGSGQTITAANYTVELDADYVWQMEVQGKELYLDLASNTNDPYQLKIVSRDGENFYSHNYQIPPYKEVSSDPQHKRFYRMVQIMNIEESGGIPVSMDVRSTVQWVAQGKSHAVSLDSRLTNYQKIKK